MGLWETFIYLSHIHGIMVKWDKEILSQPKIDSKNRITLSPKVLEVLNISEGDFVSIEMVDGSVCLHKAYMCVRRNGGVKDGNVEGVE